MNTDSIPLTITDSFFTGETVVIFLLFLVSLLFSGFVSYCEAVITSVDVRRFQISKYSTSRQGKRLLDFLLMPQRLLFVFVSTKAILFIACSSLLIYLLRSYWPESMFTVPFAIITVFFCTTIIYLFNQVICFRLGEGKFSKAIKFTPFIYFFYLFSKPVVFFFEMLLNVQQKLAPPEKEELTLSELPKVMDLTNEEIDEGKELLEGLVNFKDKTAVEIMTPREDMICMDISVSLDEIIETIVEMHYSRIPIYEKSEDNIRGILYIKDLLPFLGNEKTASWRQLIRQAYFVPESKKIDILLKEFRSNKIHLAIVVDEYGGTSGLVTMEDILEEIVGEINDEYDEDKKSYVLLPDGSMIFEGKTLLTDFFKAVDVDEEEFEELTDDVDTLAGLILEMKGDFPRRQEVITYKSCRFKILEMTKRRIVKVQFSQENQTDEES